MLEEVRSAVIPFSIKFDESPNVKGDNQLDIYVVYWSKRYNKVITVYLKSLPLAVATGDFIFKTVWDIVENVVYSIKGMVALGTDGPNTMKKVHRLFNEKLEGLRGYGLLEIGTRSLHIVHNAFGKAFETWNSDKVLYHTAKFFEGSVPF